MEKEQTEQIKIDGAEKTEVKVDYIPNDFSDGSITKLMDIVGGFRTVSEVPTHKPTDIVDQILMYKNGTTQRLYYYDIKNDSWQYSTQTPTTQQYVFTTYTHNNNGYSSANYTDTVTAGFAPHTVFFYGRQYQSAGGSYHYITNGMACKNDGSVTTGSSSWQRTGSSGVLSSKLGGISVNDFVSVTTWGTNGVTLSTTLSPGGGVDNILEGVVICIG